ncbi:Putrescine:ornithine antiporter, partial [human gut metagenome]
FLGFESAAANADAVENPKKNVPIATVAGTLAVAVVYILSTNVMAGIVPNVDLLNSNAPFGLTFVYMFNDTIANIVMAAMVISCFGALLCWQFTLSRVFKSAAEHGYFP